MWHKLLRFLIVLIVPVISVEANAVQKNCIFSAVKGRLFFEGAPVIDARVIRTYESEGLKTDETTTDSTGLFHFPALYERSFASLLPREFVVAQAMSVSYKDREYKIWSNTKRSKRDNSELGGSPLNLSCELTEGLNTYRDFGSILRTNCLFGETVVIDDIYRFSDHFPSIAWLHDLSGVISNEVDLAYSVITINRSEGGTHIYVGPKQQDNGGSGVSIWLDENLHLKEYEIEHLAPLPLNQ